MGIINPSTSTMSPLKKTSNSIYPEGASVTSTCSSHQVVVHTTRHGKETSL
jgi:hypothetical protein